MKKLKINLMQASEDLYQELGFAKASSAQGFIGAVRQGYLSGGSGKRANPEQALERLSVLLYYLGMTEESPVIADPGSDPFNPPENPKKIPLIKYIKELEPNFAYPPAKPPKKRIAEKHVQAAGLEKIVFAA